MALHQIKIKFPIQTTTASFGSGPVPAYRIFFTIDGAGDYSVLVPQQGYSADQYDAAVQAAAQPIIQLMDRHS